MAWAVVTKRNVAVSSPAALGWGGRLGVTTHSWESKSGNQVGVALGL